MQVPELLPCPPVFAHQVYLVCLILVASLITCTESAPVSPEIGLKFQTH
jgi:hypothetical protein